MLRYQSSHLTMQPCAPAPLPGIPAQSAVTCILSVTTVGPIPLQPWSALGLHLVRTRASCIRHTEALAHTLLKRMPTETAGNRVRPHHAHYARGASGCARRSPKRARGAGRHAPTTCQRARRARAPWRQGCPGGFAATRARARPGSAPSPACAAAGPARPQRVRQCALCCTRFCRAQARCTNNVRRRGRAVAQGFKSRVLPGRQRRTQSSGSPPLRRSDTPQPQSLADALRAADQARGAGGTAALQDGGAAAQLPSFAQHRPCAETARLLAAPKRPGAPMKIHCHPRSPPFPFKYSSPAASGAPIICSRQEASGRCQPPKCPHNNRPPSLPGALRAMKLPSLSLRAPKNPHTCSEQHRHTAERARAALREPRAGGARC